MTATGAPAVLLGESMDVAWALRAAGSRVTVVGGPHAPARYSRHSLHWERDPRPDDDRLVSLLADLSGGLRPALVYETDRDLLFVSRYRDRLPCRFVLPPAELLAQLVDKGRFARLASDLRLCVPWSASLPCGAPFRAPDAAYPLLVKPSVRTARWVEHAGGQKAVVVHSVGQLQALLSALAPSTPEVVVQAYIPGPETQVESYHVYLAADGQVVAEFTGRKIRTYPAVNGFSTALVTTDCPDLLVVGRSVVRALGLVGVAKLDFKRDVDGRLWLLEVNPRFNLWHKLGAVAGVNLPQLVLADLFGLPRPLVRPARPGVMWCHVPKDLIAARAAGMTTSAWMSWARGCEALGGLQLDDPLPFLAGRVLPSLLHRHHTAPSLPAGHDGAAVMVEG
jgi:D-aspartate ligase